MNAPLNAPLNHAADITGLLRSHSLVVCVGPGGVGKTTLAAALALAGARQGRRTAVITIDPARRLACALGLDGLDDELRPVADLPLHAAMLDTKSSYDALIARIAGDPEVRERILSNRVYRSFSRTLARSHAYIAMERLYDVLTNTDHDLVILDTPPTRSALEILDAPGRLIRFLDERIIGAFVGAEVGREPGGGAREWIRERGTQVAMKLFGAMAGDALMEELAEFFSAFVQLRRGFAERADYVRGRLESEQTAFVLVTAPDATHLDDAAYLRDGLLARGTEVHAIIYNRAFHADEAGAPLGPGADWPDEAVVGPGCEEASLREVRAAARANRARIAEENLACSAAIRAFEADLQDDALERGERASAVRVRLPRLDSEPASLAGLDRLLAGARPLRPSEEVDQGQGK